MSTVEVINIEKLVSTIQETNHYFLNQAQKQVNTALTVRNWVIGFHIVEYEKYGDDRAEYGQGLFKEIVNKLKNGGLSSIRERHLYLCKDFYKAYPKILQTVSAKLHLSDNQYNTILRTVSAKSLDSTFSQTQTIRFQTDPELLLNKLSFSHFIELLKSDSPSKRSFYEMEAIKNNWSVRDLQRSLTKVIIHL